MVPSPFASNVRNTCSANCGNGEKNGVRRYQTFSLVQLGQAIRLIRETLPFSSFLPFPLLCLNLDNFLFVRFILDILCINIILTVFIIICFLFVLFDFYFSFVLFEKYLPKMYENHVCYGKNTKSH
jgi:hypothetical protein